MRVFVALLFLCIFPLPAQSAESRSAILIMGDSLSAGYGISQSDVWVTLLQRRLDRLHSSYQVVNASISGDTTRGGLSRLPKTLEREKPEIVIIELGGNDGLRGLSLDKTADNLDRMITFCKQSGVDVLLLGIQLPHNYGTQYREKFHQIYLDIAEKRSIAIVPFFLKGVAETREMMQADGVHPAASAQPIVLENVWQELEPMLK